MTRQEAIEILKAKAECYDIDGLSCERRPSNCAECEEAIEMAMVALSAEQKEEDLTNDIARRMATIIENEQDMRVILKNASDAVEVVRCKDCRKQGSDDCPMFSREWRTITRGNECVDDFVFHDLTKPSGFCNYGERKTE